MASGADYRKHQKSLIGGASVHQVAANLTRYDYIFGSPIFVAEVDARCQVQFACRLTNMNIRADNPPGAGETYDVTLMLNGIATLLTLQIAGAVAVEAGPDVDVVALVPGDEISIRIVTSLNAAAVYLSWSFELNR